MEDYSVRNMKHLELNKPSQPVGHIAKTPLVDIRKGFLN